MEIGAINQNQRMQNAYLSLGIAIVAEVIATTAMKSAAGFTRLVPSGITLIGYAVAFYFLSRTLTVIPTGIAYAIWSGAGIVMISLAAWLLHDQALDLVAFIGIGLIVSGVVVLNVFSTAGTH